MTDDDAAFRGTTFPQMLKRNQMMALIGCLLLAACATPAPPASPTPAPAATPAPPIIPTPIPTATLSSVAAAPTAEEYAVYGAIISANWPGQPQIVIEAMTTNNFGPGGRPDLRGYVSGQLTSLQSQTIDSFMAANQITYPLANQFQISSPTILLSQAEKDKLFDRELQASWQRFHAAYPGSQGLLAFSRAGFDAALDQALVYYQNGKGGLDAAGYLVLLEKVQGSWSVQKQLQLWVA